ncbi:hypothetical protein GCM10022251_28590 [Phytohabitans flavus]|uniref:Uncharacterized protein n=1 Tax=Phytohabitans flavus TaxID=1076124 RepID=A0A6F8XNW8_9ACTN|nr:hypothetical protein Pflav_019350 [Phytohabitans flavus]
MAWYLPVRMGSATVLGVTDVRPAQWETDTCSVCPAQLLQAGEFDVIDRPGPDSRYEPARGYRVNVHSGAPTCVHPYRVGLPPAAYASAGVPVLEILDEPPAPTPAALALPVDLTDLEGWLIAVLRDAGPDRMYGALAAAETEAVARFPEKTVVAAMRRVLSVELARSD